MGLTVEYLASSRVLIANLKRPESHRRQHKHQTTDYLNEIVECRDESNGALAVIVVTNRFVLTQTLQQWNASIRCFCQNRISQLLQVLR